MPEKPSGRGPFLAYNGALAAASPLLLGWYAYRVLGSGKSRDGWLERLGWPSESQRQIARGENVWFHAVSVGEVVAVSPVIRAYMAMPDALQPALSTITTTGADMASRVLPEISRFYLPVDVLPAVRAVVRRLRPRCLALCEAELWPNLLSEVRSSVAPVVLLNGRVTDHTMQRAQRHGWVFRWALSNINRFLMQTEGDAERIVTLGADESLVEVTGNTKFDEADEPLSPEQRAELAASLGVDLAEPLFVAGSTNPGEDELVLDAFVRARETVPGLRLIIAPRQIERADQILALSRERGLSAQKRSDGVAAPGTAAIILNTFGELGKVYSLARAAFVGGTFIDKGGHNILQPLAQGIPVVYGPYDYKIRDIGARGISAGVAWRVESPGELAARVVHLVKDSDPTEQSRVCLDLINENRGASRRSAEVIAALADTAGEGER